MKGGFVTLHGQATLIVLSIVLSFVAGIILGFFNTDETLSVLRMRIKELGDKSTQLLVFLSFAITAAVVLIGYGQVSTNTNLMFDKVAQSGALRSWVSAIFPVVIGVLPLKEFSWRPNHRWYRSVRMFKFCLLWVAIAYIVVGAAKFFLAF
jgi:hypothetical protein